MNVEKFHHLDSVMVKWAEESQFTDLVSTNAFQRLKDISFLGAIDPWLAKHKPQKVLKSNRFNHSIGVFSIATKIIELDKAFPENEKRLFQATALLHDLGHGPLSHSLEAIFDREFGINHHKQTNELILDSRGEVYSSLRDLHIVPSDITLLLDRKVDAHFSQYLNGPFNIDTLDGIFRCYSLNGNRPDYSLSTTIKATFLLYDQNKNEDILDSFWRMKREMYNRLIYQGYGRIADEVAQNYFEDRIAELKPEMFKMTDQEFYARFDNFKSALSSDVNSAMEGYYPSHVQKTRTRDFKVRQKCRIDSFKSLQYRYHEEKNNWAEVRSNITKEKRVEKNIKALI